jgi:predicted DNA-binding ribbon-helix-helix protein
MAVVEPGASRLQTYSIKVGGRWTTIRLEHEMMEALRDVARSLNVTVDQLCTEIAVDRFEGSFTSALRVFIVTHYRRRLAGETFRRVGRETAATIRGDRRPLDFMRRRFLPIGTRGVASELVSLHHWWSDLRVRSSRVPEHAAIEPSVFRRLGLEGLVHVVDSSAMDPMNYQIRIFGQRVRLAGERDLSGLRVGDVPGSSYRSAVAEDYLSAVTTGTPRLHEVDASVGGHRRVYQRLVVPFSGCGGMPDSLLVAVSYQSSGLVGQLG